MFDQILILGKPFVGAEGLVVRAVEDLILEHEIRHR